MIIAIFVVSCVALLMNWIGALREDPRSQTPYYIALVILSGWVIDQSLGVCLLGSTIGIDFLISLRDN